ncbi:hypothetical protein MHU86_3722 [Fragilaria crotonensis]|nr:hypothetical protein MHU86_3722 [Fragilaria crotonensis]
MWGQRLTRNNNQWLIIIAHISTHDNIADRLPNACHPILVIIWSVHGHVIEIHPAKRGADSASNATDDSTKRGDSEMKKADATTTVSWADTVKRAPPSTVVEWHPDNPIDDSEYDRDYDDRPLDDEPLLNFDLIDDGELTDLAVPDIVPVAAPNPRLAQGAPRENDDVHDLNEDDADDADVDDHRYHEPLVSDDDIDLMRPTMSTIPTELQIILVMIMGTTHPRMHTRTYMATPRALGAMLTTTTFASSQMAQLNRPTKRIRGSSSSTGPTRHVRLRPSDPTTTYETAALERALLGAQWTVPIVASRTTHLLR